MITISDSIITSDSIIDYYERNSIERKIINIIASSSKIYKYNSLNELKFEINLRKNIIIASRELNDSNMTFEIFREARCNTNYWNLTEEGGFLLKDGAIPSAAIKDIYINGSKYGTECATAMVIVYYKALLNIFPENLFNELFSKIHLMNWHYIDKNLASIGYMENAEDYLPGDRRYFKNPDVNPRTPEWQGENVIDLGNGSYYGHGIGIKNSDQIIAKLNSRRKSGATRSAVLLDSVGRPDFKYLAKIYFNYTSRFRDKNYKTA